MSVSLVNLDIFKIFIFSNTLLLGYSLTVSITFHSSMTFYQPAITILLFFCVLLKGVDCKSQVRARIYYSVYDHF